MNLSQLLETPPWDWPEDAERTLRKTLTDRSAQEADRITAADLAGEFHVINDDLAGVLLDIVSNAKEPAELRATAAISLGPVLEYAETHEFDEPDEITVGDPTIRKIRETLKKLYPDGSIPKIVRRRILEAAVRSPDAWQEDAIRSAYASADPEWILTSVLGMAHVRGFDDQILEALNNTDPEIHLEAVNAAGNWALKAAWPHVVALINDEKTPKPLKLAAIEAAGSIRAGALPEALLDLVDSEDEEIAEAAEEAMMMADGASDDVDEEDLEEDEWVN